jgi:hypothetical protein
MAAREMGVVSLADALALTLLTVEVGDDRWPRAAARWLGRFVVESPTMTIGEAALAAAAIQELVSRDSRLAAETLRQLAATHGHGMVAALLESRPLAPSRSPFPPEKPHHAAFSPPLSSISRSRSLARSADEAAEPSSFASLPCLSSSSRSDVRSFKFPSPFCVDGARRKTGNARS